MLPYFEGNSIEDYEMNEMVKKFLLAGDRFMVKCIKNSLNLLIVHVGYSQKTKKEYKISTKKVIQDVFIKMN